MNISFTIPCIILSILLAELIYFLISTLFYIYRNPQYRVFWAAFCKEPPENLTKLKEASKSKFQLYDVDQTSTKTNAFVFYGLETISHSIIVILFLICWIFNIAVYFYYTYINTNYLWYKQLYFCRNVVQYIGFILIMPKYLFLMFLLCTIISGEQLRNVLLKNDLLSNNKFQFVYVQIATLIWCIICALVEGGSSLWQRYDIVTCDDVVNFSACHPIESNTILVLYNKLQFAVCLTLTMISCLVPLFSQQEMLKSVPNESQNNAKNVYLQKIRKLQKRIAIPSILFSIIHYFIIFMNIRCTILIYCYHCGATSGARAFRTHLVYVFIGVQLYFVTALIHNDFKQRVCRICKKMSCSIKIEFKIDNEADKSRQSVQEPESKGSKTAHTATTSTTTSATTSSEIERNRALNAYFFQKCRDGEIQPIPTELIKTYTNEKPENNRNFPTIQEGVEQT